MSCRLHRSQTLQHLLNIYTYKSEQSFREHILYFKEQPPAIEKLEAFGYTNPYYDVLGEALHITLQNLANPYWRLNSGIAH